MAQVHRLDNNQLDMYKVPAGAEGARFMGQSGLIKAYYQGRWQVYCPWEAAWYESAEAWYDACEARAEG